MFQNEWYGHQKTWHATDLTCWTDFWPLPKGSYEVASNIDLSSVRFSHPYQAFFPQGIRVLKRSLLMFLPTWVTARSDQWCCDWNNVFQSKLSWLNLRRCCHARNNQGTVVALWIDLCSFFIVLMWPFFSLILSVYVLENCSRDFEGTYVCSLIVKLKSQILAALLLKNKMCFFPDCLHSISSPVSQSISHSDTTCKRTNHIVCLFFFFLLPQSLIACLTKTAHVM